MYMYADKERNKKSHFLSTILLKAPPDIFSSLYINQTDRLNKTNLLIPLRHFLFSYIVIEQHKGIVIYICQNHFTIFDWRGRQALQKCFFLACLEKKERVATYLTTCCDTSQIQKRERERDATIPKTQKLLCPQTIDAFWVAHCCFSSALVWSPSERPSYFIVRDVGSPFCVPPSLCCGGMAAHISMYVYVRTTQSIPIFSHVCIHVYGFILFCACCGYGRYKYTYGDD